MEETGGENDPAPAEEGVCCSVKFVDFPPLAALPIPPFPLAPLPHPRRFFFLQRTRKHDRRAIDPKALYDETAAKRGIPAEIYIRNGAQ